MCQTLNDFAYFLTFSSIHYKNERLRNCSITYNEFCEMFYIVRARYEYRLNIYAIYISLIQMISALVENVF